MKRILCFAGSNKSTSINQKFVKFAASQIKGFDVKVIKLTDYEITMYGEDVEKERGYSSELRMLLQEIADADGIIISVNEHNSGVSAFFKNTIDWLSRLDRNFLEGKKILVMATSPGGRGAISALEYTKNTLPRFGTKVVESFSLPKFYENYSEEENRIIDESLSLSFNDVLKNFLRQLEQ